MSESEAARIVEQRDRIHHGGVVVERLAHSHEHDVGDALAARREPARQKPGLIEDLDRR